MKRKGGGAIGGGEGKRVAAAPLSMHCDDGLESKYCCTQRLLPPLDAFVKGLTISHIDGSLLRGGDPPRTGSSSEAVSRVMKSGMCFPHASLSPVLPSAALPSTAASSNEFAPERQQKIPPQSASKSLQ